MRLTEEEKGMLDGAEGPRHELFGQCFTGKILV